MSTPSETDAVSEPRWLGHGTLHLPGTPEIVCDPWKWRGDDCEVGLVLLTGAAADVASAHDVGRVSGPDTRILGSPSAAERLPGLRVEAVESGDRIEWGAWTVEVLPAEGPPRRGAPSRFLPRSDLRAYRLSVLGRTFLVLGGSRLLPEHVSAHPPDVAWFAVGGVVWPTVEEAVGYALELRPRLAVPTFWGDLTARHDAAARFVEACSVGGVAARVG